MLCLECYAPLAIFLLLSVNLLAVPMWNSAVFFFSPPSLKACGPRLLTANPTSKANSARLYSRSFTPLAVFSLSFQLIPPDENLIGHFKASARGLTALDLTVSDSLLVLWSLSQSLKGLLQPIYSNPLFRVQLDQKGTQCNPKDRGRMGKL